MIYLVMDYLTTEFSKFLWIPIKKLHCTDVRVGGHRNNCTQVTHSTLDDALTFYDQDETTETRVLIQMICRSDCMNVRRESLEEKI